MPKKKHPRVTLSCIFAMTAAIIVFGTSIIGANILTEPEYDVIINDDGNIKEIRTGKTSVGEILLQAEVEIKEHDYISIGLNEEITSEVNNISIRRAVPITVELANETLEYYTTADTIREALSEKNISITDMDILLDNTTENEISRYEEIDEIDKIKLVKVTEEVIEEETVLPYKIITNENHDIDIGTTLIAQKGETGSKISTYNVLYEDGVPIQKTLVSEEIEKQPVHEIKEVGLMMSFETSRGEKIPYKDSMVLKATAYTAASVAGKKPGDPTYGITATGMRAKVGVVAVDKSIIPLGTKLYVESLDSTKDYGYCIAVDTGVYGNKIDLYFNTIDECFQFGRRNVKVYVLKDQSVDVFSMR